MGRESIKSVGIISFFTLISRVLGLVREMVLAAFLGTGFYSDAFSLAFALPNFFRRLGAEGTIVNAFLPRFFEIKKRDGEERALRYSSDFFGVSFFILFVLTLICVSLAPFLVDYLSVVGFQDEPMRLTVLLTQIMSLYIVLIGAVTVFQGILNSFSVFWVSSLTPILLNVSIIGLGVWLAPVLENPAIGFAIGVVVGGILQLVWHLPHLRRVGFRMRKRIHPCDPYVKKTLGVVFPTIFGVGIYHINVVVNSVVASTLSEGAVSSLRFSHRILEFTMGILIIPVSTVIMPGLSKLFVDNRPDEVRRKLQTALRLVTFITLPATVGLLIINQQLVDSLFGRGAFDANSISLTRDALSFHIIGLVFISWNRLLLDGFQAARRIGAAVRAAGIIFFVNLILALLLSRLMGHRGVALSFTIAQIVQTVVLVLYLSRISINRFLDSDLLKSVRNTFLLSIFMAFTLWILKRGVLCFTFSSMADMALLVSAGVSLYLFPAYLVGSREFNEIKQIIFRDR